jgi:ferredoxin-thioredoxin reductase catalytic chain
LYVAAAVAAEAADAAGSQKVVPVPERRGAAGEKMKMAEANAASGLSRLPLPVWRCKVCGYLCAREGPPEICPICKAKKERFERFM